MKRLILIPLFLGISSVALLAGTGLLTPEIPLGTELPPMVIALAATEVRALPNGRAKPLASVGKGRVMYLRCNSGEPLLLGNWVGVLEPRTSSVGWARGSAITATTRNCPATRRAAPRMMYERTQLPADVRANIRFAPSTDALVVGKAAAGMPLWTDKRYVKLHDHTWIPVMTGTGTTGWIRQDLLKGGTE